MIDYSSYQNKEVSHLWLLQTSSSNTINSLSLNQFRINKNARLKINNTMVYFRYQKEDRKEVSQPRKMRSCFQHLSVHLCKMLRTDCPTSGYFGFQNLRVSIPIKP